MPEDLRGFTVGVTAHRRSAEQISLLEGLGATCIHGPTINTHPLRPEAEIAEATSVVTRRRPRLVIATTGIGFRGWLDAADALGAGDDVRELLAEARVITRGPKAHGAVVAAGIEAEWIASPATNETVFDYVTDNVTVGTEVAVQADGASAPMLGDRLRAAGYGVIDIPVYRWSLPDDLGPAEVLIRAIVDRRVDAVTFTARPAIDNLVEIAQSLGLGDAVVAAFRTDVLPMCVGPICAARAIEVGMGEPLQPGRFRVGAMVQHLTDALVGTARWFRLGGADLELRGSLVRGEQLEPVVLAGRERETLEVLLERPGVVRSKRCLLDAVWGAGESNAHVVEVTVGRLRRRLGVHGQAIETVMRRGYRASPD